MSEVPNPSQQLKPGDFPYFRPLWRKIVWALLAASFIPMVFIGGGMYYYAMSTIKEKTIETLRREILTHSRSIDGFLEERTGDLHLLSTNLDSETLTSPASLERAFSSLNEGLPYFTDLGVIDSQGRHLAYVGPYSLLSRNYRGEEWFQAVLNKGTFISDVFWGFRNEPHFVIAVKVQEASGAWILRATVNAAIFEDLVSGMGGLGKGTAFLVNRQGLYQTGTRPGERPNWSGIQGVEPFEGVRIQEEDGRLSIMAWQGRIPWLLVVQQEKREIYGPLDRLRNLGLYVFVLGGIVLVLTVLFSTNHLVSRLERKRQSIHSLDYQLRQSSKVASAAQLASGLLQDLKDRTANIEIAATWIRDLLDRDLTEVENRKEVEGSLAQMISEAARTRKSLDHFFKAVRPSVPIVREFSMKDILEDALELLERELHFNHIEIERDYPESLSPIRSDPSEIRQIFLNLLMNAIKAIQKQGVVRLRIREKEEGIEIIVEDNGRGIPGDQIGKIFDPLFTTQSGRPGLGLSICADTLRKLGGRISVESEPGRGTTFSVFLPFHFGPSAT